MQAKTQHTILSYFIALVWFVNGLFCKILNWVPRHEAIVAQILSTEYSRILIVLIGFAEIIMAIWILTRFFPKLNGITQMLIVGIMNILEFILVPDLLLWGYWNSFFALGFIALIYYHSFILDQKSSP